MRGIILVALICSAFIIGAYLIYYLLDEEHGITLGFIAGIFYMASTKNIKFDK